MKTTLTAATSSAVRVLIAAGFITLLSTLQAAPTVSNLSWLAGVWDGIGDDGTTKGDARTVWTEPVEGVMSWTFRWHQDDHVHFAFSVVEDTGDEVLLRGIHHGRDFDTFEDVNWTMRLAEAGPQLARFECVEHCRAASVEFSMSPDGQLEESWRTTTKADPGFVIRYRRRNLD
jgi:hypothetical protein